MKFDATLKLLERQFSLCIRCKQCTYGSWPDNYAVCPINDRYKFFTYSGGGIIYLARAMLLGLIEAPNYREVLEVISKCTSCGHCGATCQLVKAGPPFQNVSDLVKLVKANIVQQGTYLSERHKSIIEALKKDRRPFQPKEEEESAFNSLKHKVPNKGDILIFSGCITSYKGSNPLKAALSILDRYGVKYCMMDKEWCCGSPLIDLGDSRSIYEFAEHNLEAIKGTGARKILFLCPHCQETFKNVYPQVTNQALDFDVVSVGRYFNEIVDRRELSSLKSIANNLSYHDSCYSGRYLGDFASARELLQKIPEVHFVEMKRNKQDSYCCGAGGGSKVLDPANAMAIGAERMKDFERTGAEVLVTSCPWCKLQFRDVAGNARKEVVIKDIAEVLDDALNQKG